MGKWIIRGVLALGAVAIVLAALVWLTLAAPMFSSVRAELAEHILQKDLGQDIEISGGVRVVPGETLQIRAEGVTFPGRAPALGPLAAVGALDFGLALRPLLNGQIKVENITLDGLQVTLAVGADGNRTWGKAETGQKKSDKKGPGLMTVLSRQSAKLSNAILTYRNEINGMEFDFDLNSVDLAGNPDGLGFAVTGEGKVNDRPFKLTSAFKEGRPADIDVQMGSTRITWTGGATEGTSGAGYAGDLAIDITAFGDLLDVLKLQRTMEGAGRFSLRLTDTAAGLGVEDLTGQVTFQSGRVFSATGSVVDLRTSKGVDVVFDLKLYPPDRMPPPARYLNDIRLTELGLVLKGDMKSEALRQSVITTNAFSGKAGGFGLSPITIGSIRRMPDDALSIQDVTLKLGPTGAPYLTIAGSLENAMRLRGVAIDGAATVPLSLFVADFEIAGIDALGGFDAKFRIGDKDGPVSIENLVAQSINTKLWNFDLTGSIEELFKFKNVTTSIDFRIPDAAPLLSSLDLDPVQTGPFVVSTMMSSSGRDWKASIGIDAGQSDLHAHMELDDAEVSPVVRGGIDSKLLRTADIRNVAAAVVQMWAFSKEVVTGKDGPAKAEPAVAGAKLPDGVKVQPLVLPDSPSDDQGDGASGDSDAANDGFHVVNKAKLLRDIDLLFTFDLERVEGPKGVTEIKTDVVVKDGQSQFGPVKFTYGEGTIDVTGTIDAVSDPETLKLKGSAGGWDLGAIMKDIGVEIGARGHLSAYFDVAGPHQSVKAYARSMSGAVTLAMNNGAIGTNLLELAGKGVLPWLFSKKSKDGFTPVVCLRVPLAASSGKFSSQSMVLETQDIQMVAWGSLDWARNRIDLRAEPRPIGKPLARSPWPFTVNGALSDPTFKLLVGGRRMKRTDGADTMPAKRVKCKPDILQLK